MEQSFLVQSQLHQQVYSQGLQEGWDFTLLIPKMGNGKLCRFPFPPGKVNWENVSSLLSDAVSDGHSSVNKTNCQLGLPSFSLALHRLVPGEHPAET